LNFAVAEGAPQAVGRKGSPGTATEDDDSLHEFSITTDTAANGGYDPTAGIVGPVRRVAWFVGTEFGDVLAGASLGPSSSILGEWRLCDAPICRALSTGSSLPANARMHNVERARDIEAVRPSAAETRLSTDAVLLHVLSWRSFAHRENQDLRLVVAAFSEWQ
jgi:hypothetical protein